MYGFSGLFDPPEFASASRSGNQIIPRFRHCGSGLTDDSTPEKGFIVTPDGQKPEIAGCTASGDTVVLTLPDAADAPLRISYAEEDYCTVHIWNPAGLSAKPFYCEI